jgi:NDP-sugar pyrophosphorylase family protein
LERTEAGVSSPAHALVLTAGLGTRLQPLTSVRAKPAVPVGGVPLVRRIIASLADQGVTDLVLNLHHLPETLAAIVGDGSDFGARVRYSWEQPIVLGSAGGPRQALAMVGADPFFVVNGDTLTDVPLAAAAAEHARTGALVTLALVRNMEYLRYGGVTVAADGTVTGFVPHGPAAAGSFHFIGVQMVSPDAFKAIASGSAANSIGGAYNTLLDTRPGSIRAFICDAASFWDIGTVTDYWKTSMAFAPPPRPRSIVWDEVDIGEDCVLEDCIVTDHVRVPAGSVYRRMVLVAAADGSPLATPFSTE